jgi:DNA-binding response OmpR family regulator
MSVTDLAACDAVTTFGQRRIAPRACIIDAKRHIRTFLGEALDELGFITCAGAGADDLRTLVDTHLPDLVVLGLPKDGIEADDIFRSLGAGRYDGQVLLIGPKDSHVMTAMRQLGDECGVALLPPLATPFSAEGLRAGVATLLPQQAPPSPAVDVAEALKAGWL